MQARISLGCIACFMLLASWGPRARAQENVAIRPGVLWTVDLGVGQGYNDNPFGDGRGGYFAQFDPQLRLDEHTRHDFWSLNLQTSVQQFYNSSVSDRVNESAAFTDSWQVSRRWTFNLLGNYLHSSDPLANSQETGETQAVGAPPIVSPNSAFIGPQLPFSVLEGSSTIAYQAGRYTQLTFGGDYSTYRENAPQLPNTTSHSFRAGYSRTIRHGQTIGLDYSAQFVTIVNPGENTTTNTLSLSYSLAWKDGRGLSFFAGPQYSSIGGNLASTAGSGLPFVEAGQQILSFSAGAAFSLLLTQQNSFHLTAARRVSGGGGVSGLAIQDEADLGLSHRFNKRFSGSTGAFYSEYQPLGNLPIAQSSSWGTFNRAQFNLTPYNSISIEYDYFHQLLSQPSLGALFSDNRALIEYHYSFGSLARQR